MQGQLKAIMHGFKASPLNLRSYSSGVSIAFESIFPNHVLGFADHSAPTVRLLRLPRLQHSYPVPPYLNGIYDGGQLIQS